MLEWLTMELTDNYTCSCYYNFRLFFNIYLALNINDRHKACEIDYDEKKNYEKIVIFGFTNIVLIKFKNKEFKVIACTHKFRYFEIKFVKFHFLSFLYFKFIYLM